MKWTRTIEKISRDVSFTVVPSDEFDAYSRDVKVILIPEIKKVQGEGKTPDSLSIQTLHVDENRRELEVRVDKNGGVYALIKKREKDDAAGWQVNIYRNVVTK